LTKSFSPCILNLMKKSMKKQFICIFLIFTMLLLFPGCTGGGSSYLRSERGKKELLRLLLSNNTSSLELQVKSPFKLSGSTETAFDRKSFKAEINNNSIVIDGNAYGTGVKIIPDNRKFLLNKAEYRGNLIIYIKAGKLCAVEDFTMEEYLYGVVGKEMSGNSPIEALKAQAVAARTFGYYEAGIRKNKDYDIDNLLQSQAYDGTESENPRSIEAVELTCGEVMKYKGEIIFAAFSANCGGYTEENKEVFGTFLPYLQAVPCPFCKMYPHASWQEAIETAYIVNCLKKKGIDINRISGIEITDTSKAGRVKQIAIICDKGRINMPTNEFRLAIGSDKFKSARFTVRSRGENLVFTGKGWGHGVGMCQDGADGMARTGNNYRRILTRYYLGVEIGQK